MKTFIVVIYCLQNLFPCSDLDKDNNITMCNQWELNQQEDDYKIDIKDHWVVLSFISGDYAGHVYSMPADQCSVSRIKKPIKKKQ